MNGFDSYTNDKLVKLNSLMTSPPDLGSGNNVHWRNKLRGIGRRKLTFPIDFPLVQCPSPKVPSSPVTARKLPMAPPTPSLCHTVAVPAPASIAMLPATEPPAAVGIAHFLNEQALCKMKRRRSPSSFL